MKLYDSADLPIRDDLADAHQQAWRELAEPGTWWTGAERVAIAASGRNACIRAGLNEGDAATLPATLSDAAVEVAEAVGAAPGLLRKDWFGARVPGRIEEGPYVEAIGVLALTSCIDTFCRGVGLALHEYPEPVAGEPTCSTPGALAREEAAWVAMIPEGSPDGDELYGGPTVNVVRALSQVPAEVQSWMRVAGTQYVHVSIIEDMQAPYDRAIDRTQIELVAGRVSALNECFY